ncbi:MAG: EAL domain-containing protein [Steroidobacteraceae bacterium]
MPALERVHLALQARLEVDDAGRRSDLDTALKELTRLTAIFPWMQIDTGRSAGANTPNALVEAYIQQASSAVKIADSRRSFIAKYRENLTALEATLAQAIDKGWKVLGRLVARQSLINLSRALQAIENNSTALSAANYVDASGVETLSASEDAFAAELTKSREGLRRSQGLQWETRLSAGFDALKSTRAAAISADQKIRSQTSQLAQRRSRIMELAQAALQSATLRERPAADGPTALPLPVSAVLPATPVPEERIERRVSRTLAPEDQAARTWVVWITVAVLVCILALTLSTIESIVRPVRRLIQATRTLSGGGDARVTRGGIKELDDLAVAFNEMATQLVSARAEVLAHQGTLEKRVRDRTQELQHQAEHDWLTQLPNRRLLLERLNAALQCATDSGTRVGVFFIDLDNFKNINDSMGHEFGDLVLLSVSQRLSETAASFGFAARLGGDEFTILYPEAPSAEAIAEMGGIILRAFQRPLAVGDRELTLSASVGASIFPDHGAEAETLLRAADAALFRAKALGRTQLHLFSPDLVEAARTKFVVEQGLRYALEHGEFELMYQPEMDLVSLEPTLVEALLRWRTRDGRLLAPDAFLSVAEESGLITDLSDWVLRTVIATAAAWHQGAWPEVRVAINVSSRQLFDVQFVNRVEELLKHHNLPPRCIEIELTENVLQTGATTIDALRRLRASGIAIALDDFGTGYSSFASLEVLPLTRVKLDRSLVSSIDTNPPSRAIASSIIDLCRNLGFEVTAEGVERPEQLAMLVEHGATHIQGYLLSRPVSRDDLMAELSALRGRMESILLTLPAPTSAVLPRDRSKAEPGTRRHHG